MRILLLALVLAVAIAQPQWVVQRHNLATILTGVSFADSQRGWLSGAQDGVGPMIYRTLDGGADYQPAQPVGQAFFYLGIASHQNGRSNVATGGPSIIIFSGMEYSTDGNVFQPSQGFGLIATTQSVEPIHGTGGLGFAMTGQWESGTGDEALSGVAVSLNGGANYNLINSRCPSPPRYGSFPNGREYWISAGSWPRNWNIRESKNTVMLSERIAVTNDGKTIKKQIDTNIGEPKKEGYRANVCKSSDGGSTWTVDFTGDGSFYFNGISCPPVPVGSRVTCWVVAEGGSLGAQIWSNFGGVWARQWQGASPALGLFDVHMLSATRGWATGGELNQNFGGIMLQTTDGATWNLVQRIPGVFGNKLTFHQNLGWATAFTIQGGSSVLHLPASAEDKDEVHIF